MVQNNRIFANVSKSGLCSLFVNPAFQTDAGTYECEASDSSGAQRAGANVTVQS